MERTIGMDVHAASCTLAVISKTGRKLRGFPVETNGRALTRVGDVVRARPRIESLLRSRGILVSGVNVCGVRPREDWQKQLGSSAQTRAMRLYDPLDFLLEQKKQAEPDLLREASKHAIVRIPETAPGFGPIRAARLVWFRSS